MGRLMNFEETKQYLRTSKATLYRWATEGTIPAIKVRNQWRFKANHIDKWLDDHENTKKRNRRKRK